MTRPTDSYRPAIDSLRAIAALAVAASHWVPWGAWRINWGYAGVGLFFVISGYVMFRHYGQTFATYLNGSTVTQFYGRRAFRILPAYYVALALYYITGRYTVGDMPLAVLLSQATFTSNLLMAWTGGFFAPVHLWSVGVEQQFYLVFPLLAAFVARRNMVAGLLVIILAIAPLRYGAYIGSGGNVPLLLFSPISCLDALLAGVLAAQAETSGETHRTLINCMGALGLAILLLIVVIGGAASDPLSNTAMALIGAWLLFNRNFERSPLAWLDQAPLRFLGRISFGFYLYHLLIGSRVPGMFGLEPGTNAAAVASCVATILVATASWYVLERPLIRLGQRFFGTSSARRKASEAVTTPAG